MADRVSRLLSEQAALIRDCRSEIEGSKLALWQFKAEHDDLRLQLARAERRLVDSEGQYARFLSESKHLGKELAAVGESFSKEHCRMVLIGSGRTGIVLDVAEALCIMCGFSERNWDFFKKLMKEFRTLSESLRNFDSSCADPDELPRVQFLIHAHQLDKVLENSSLAEELQPLVQWLLLAVRSVQQEHSALAISLKLPLLANEKNELYTQTKELEDNIQELEGKLDRLLECIEAAERNIRRLKEDPSSDEIEETEHHCKEVGMLARRNVGTDNIISHMAKSEEFKAFRDLEEGEKGSSSAALVNSLYISHAISPQLQGQLKSILENQGVQIEDLNESSVDHTETLQVPKSSTEATAKPAAVRSASEKPQAQPKSQAKPKRRKNKCCGFV